MLSPTRASAWPPSAVLALAFPLLSFPASGCSLFESEPPGCPAGYTEIDGRCHPPEPRPADPCLDGSVDPSCMAYADGGVEDAGVDAGDGGESDAGELDAGPGEEPCETSIWYRDGDGDRYGDDGATMEACEAPEGYVAMGGDCDDACADCLPADGDESACDGVDNDCDGMIDDGLLKPFHPDADGDGHGDPDADPMMACAAPEGYVAAAAADDCDDGKAKRAPGLTETCDGLDNDCDGSVDEGEIGTRWYRDCDGDGYASADAMSRRSCDRPTIGSCDWVDRRPTEGNSDCHDDVSRAHPDTDHFSADPIPGTTDDHDWDCDGDEELHPVYASYGEGGCGTNCGPFWLNGPRPACGETNVGIGLCNRVCSGGYGGTCTADHMCEITGATGDPISIIECQ